MVSARQLPLEFGTKPPKVRSKMEKAFWAYHEAHPGTYAYLVQFAKEWRQRRGPDAFCGMKMLWERFRWEAALAGADEEGFKANNIFTAFYARLIMLQEPDLKGIFRLRKQRTKATIGD